MGGPGSGIKGHRTASRKSAIRKMVARAKQAGREMMKHSRGSFPHGDNPTLARAARLQRAAIKLGANSTRVYNAMIKAYFRSGGF